MNELNQYIWHCFSQEIQILVIYSIVEDFALFCIFPVKFTPNFRICYSTIHKSGSSHHIQLLTNIVLTINLTNVCKIYKN